MELNFLLDEDFRLFLELSGVVLSSVLGFNFIKYKKVLETVVKGVEIYSEIKENDSTSTTVKKIIFNEVCKKDESLNGFKAIANDTIQKSLRKSYPK